jgi:hypothetical protein
MDTNSTPDRATVGPYTIATPSAKEAVLVANTPSFLLDRLRKDIAVQFVLDNMKPHEIVAALREGLANPPSDPVALVPLYVYLVALSSVDPSEQKIWNELRSLDLSRLEWAETIRSLVLADAVPTTTMDFTFASPLRP